MTDIDEARRKLEEAQFQMIEAYLDKIRVSYASLPERKRQELMRGLEGIVESLQKSSGVDKASFEISVARDIRIKLNLNQSDVASQVGCSAQCISMYERGELIPDPKGKFSRKYLEWLKQQGYDPYNLQ